MNDATDSIQEHEWSLQDYINISIRHRILIIIIFILVIAITLAYTLTRKDRYIAASSFMIESSDSQVSTLLGQSGYSYFGEQDRLRKIEFYQAMIGSAMYHEKLYIAARSDSVLQRLKLSEEILQKALSFVQLEPSEKNELLSLSAIAYDSVIAYRMAVVALETFKARVKEVQLVETRNVVQYVDQQKNIAGDKLEVTERALQEAQKGGTANLPVMESGILNKLSELELQLTDVQTQRELAEANISVYDQRLKQLKVTDTGGLNETQSPEIRALQAELSKLADEKSQLTLAGAPGAQISAVDSRINSRKDELYQAIMTASRGTQNNDMAMDQSIANQIRESRIKEELNLYILKNRERYFKQILESYRRENPRMIDRALEESRLKRGKSVYENLYNILLEKGEEARIRAATGTGGIRILDEPRMPKEPMPKNTRRNFMVGIILGLAMGFGLALVLEFMDNTFRSNEEVEKRLHIPVLGTVPDIRSSKGIIGKSGVSKNKNRVRTSKEETIGGYHDHLITGLRPRDPVVDTYRTLRTNMQFAVVDKPIRSLLVTSSIPGEGKTLTTANLGITFAELGKKVVIVDGDLRKPMIHNVFNIKRTPGLSDCLIKQLPVETVLAPTLVPNLYVIPCGTVPPNPSEIIASKRMSELLAQLQDQFDLVLVDSPPVTTVTDPVLFTAHTSYVIMVIKFGYTNWKFALDALNSLRHAKANVLGVILNGIRIERGYGYYYKYSYYYYSEPGEKKNTKGV